METNGRKNHATLVCNIVLCWLLVWSTCWLLSSGCERNPIGTENTVVWTTFWGELAKEQKQNDIWLIHVANHCDYGYIRYNSIVKCQVGVIGNNFLSEPLRWGINHTEGIIWIQDWMLPEGELKYVITVQEMAW